MFSKIGIGQLCGFLFLFILLTTMLSKSMAGAPLDPEDVSNTLGAVAEGGKRFQISVVLDLVSHVSVVALAGAMYLVQPAQSVVGAPGNALARGRRRDYSFQRDQKRRASRGGAQVHLCHGRRGGHVGDAGARSHRGGRLGIKDWAGLLRFGLADVRHSVRFERSRAARPGLVGGCCQPPCRRGKVVSSGQPRCGVGFGQLCAHHAL